MAVNNEEINFMNLLTNTLNRLFTLPEFQALDNNQIIAQADWEISNSFKSFPVTINFDENSILVAYFYAYSLLNTSLAYNRFIHVFEKCPDLQSIFQKEALKVISLGGGPGTDMIGFCSALQNASLIKRIDFNIVEYTRNWEVIGRIIEDLIRQGNYGSISDVFRNKTVNLSFIHMNITPGMQKSYLDNLREFDVVLIVRFLDLFLKKDEKRTGIINEHFSAMKDGAFLIIIDSNTALVPELEQFIVYKTTLDDFKLSLTPERRFSPYCRITSGANNIYVLRK